ncbi:threonine efflux protein [Agaricicola taiwanensis]|uniref:Threonine efflux protein n=1 Tax=Agaricicola taiwanensis TaxID=591372 RepID=A0A8J2VM24_9RHOB|nr:LysE family translocator [Agaricicola taiwanensis]GGE29378.1 threonine efflux protein [Agaricicola taiwanensis]
MTTADTLLSLAALWLVAVITPGPNMMLFAAISMSSSRAAVVMAALGIIIGTAVWGAAGLFGLLWLFETFPPLASAVKIAGGAYLAWKGFQIMRGSLRPAGNAADLPRRMEISPRRAFVVGLLTNLANPKSLVFVTSLFAVTHLAEKPLAIGLTGVGIMVALSATYYTTFGVLLRLTPFAQRESPLKRVVVAVVGAIMMVFGGRLAFER